MKARVYSTVDWRKYLLEESNPRVKNFLDSRGYDVFKQICGNINRANSQKKSKVVLLVHPNVGNVIVIEKQDFNNVYNIALNWYLKKECYEMCSTIKGYKENLNKKKEIKSKLSKTLI